MGLKVKRLDEDCALCRMKVANEVGSHLAPNFIIHKAFSFDGTGKRDREIVYKTFLNNEARPQFYGRAVSPEAIEADLGAPMTDEQIEANNNLLVYDNLFCKDCEKWFGMLETEYAEFYSKGKAISPRIAYLFWLSVFWRMSVGYMSIEMDIHDELEMRRILQANLSLSRDEIAASDSDLGSFGYVIWHTDGIIKGDSGIFGTRSQKCPYIIILNDLVVALVYDNQDRYSIGNRTVRRDYVNSWDDEDIYVGELSLEEFARMKRWIIDESKHDGFGEARENVYRRYMEQWRHDGAVPDWEDYLDEVDYARGIDGIYPDKELRNVARFWCAELKYQASKRLGRKEYKVLEDRSLLIFPFDIKNYRDDLMNLARKGKDVGAYPYAARLLPRRFIDPDDVKKLEDYVNEVLDDALARGYSLEDLVARPMPSES